MQNNNWKVGSYTVNSETRYRIIDKATNEILDDAQGYGFKTELNARKCFYWKLYNSKF